jgi:cobyrinic acid a,c-diamide synthase
MQISERHLGLMPSNEADGSEVQIERIRALVAAQVDTARLLAIAASAPAPPPAEVPTDGVPAGAAAVRIGIARDAAFGFYYPDDITALRRAGAELIPFSPIQDAELPAVAGLLIGGGFPEFRMRELEENRGMRASIRDFVESGGPAYAECGGLMYLCSGLRWGSERRDMCGVLAADVAMHERPQGRGYVRLRETPALPWPSRGGRQEEIRAHEFHHSAVMSPDPAWVYGFRVLRGTGVDGTHDGIVYKNLVAAYSHLRDVGGVGWTRRFVEHVRACHRG